MPRARLIPALLLLLLLLLLVLALLAPATGAGAASPAAAEQHGRTWVGEPAVTETMGEILARHRAHRGSRPDGIVPVPLARERGFIPEAGAAAPAPRGPAVDASAPAPTTGVSFLSIKGAFGTGSESGSIPPDTTGAIGPSNILVPLNGRLKIFDRAGTQLFNPTLTEFFASVNPGNPSVFDPKVEFDRISNRWFVTAENGGANNRIFIAISNGPTIANNTSFSFYFFNAGTVSGRTGDFHDYPTLGVDANALYIGTNNFAANYTSSSAFVVRKSSVTSGGPIVVTGFDTVPNTSSPGAFSPQGVENEDPAATQGYFVGVDVQAFSLLVLRRVSDPGGIPTLSANLNLTVPTTVFPVNVPAQGSTTPMEASSDRLFDAMIAKDPATGQQRLWTAHHTQVNASGAASNSGGRDGARWYEIGGLSATPSLVQSGTLFDPAASNPDSYFYPTIAANGQGHAVIGSSIAGPARFAGVALAQRFAGETAGTLSPAVVAQAGAASYTVTGGSGRNRWGDYSQVSIDPTDNMTFWAFQEYVSETNQWAVRVIEVKAPPPATPASASPASVPGGSASTNVTITGTSSNGSGFYDPGADFAKRIAANVSGGVTVNSVTFTDPTQVTLDLNTTGATPGSKNVTITNPDGQQTTGNGILTVSAPSRTLNVATGGSGSGTIIGPGINCPGDCSETYTEGAGVSLTATPAAGSTFSGFGGDCSGATCNLTMGADKSVTATFTLDRTLTVSTGGSGSGTIIGPGINCPGDCSETYTEGAGVSLTATPAAGSTFSGFGGDCSGATCNLTMGANRNVSGAFADATPPETTIDKKPKKKTDKRRAIFRFSSSEAGSSFECHIDKKNFAACSSPFKKRLKPGRHVFEVRATDAAGNTDASPARAKWKIRR